MRQVLIDTGPLVAGIDRRDKFHEWAVAQIKQAAAPLLTCEAVVSEACFLLKKVQGGEASLMELLRRGALLVPFHLQQEIPAVADLMDRYKDVPMSFADACLVRLAEVCPRSKVMTIDGDFRIYRKNRRQAIPVIMPSS